MYLSELDAYLLLYNVDKPLKVLYLISALLVKKRSSRTSIFNKVFIIFSIVQIWTNCRGGFYTMMKADYCLIVLAGAFAT
jgi:hypothetical protein